MRSVLVAAMALAAPLPAHAQTSQVDHVDIVDKGVYVVTTGDQTPNESTPTGSIAAVTVAKNVQDTTTIHGQLGSEFGLRYVVVGVPAGADVPLDIVITYPTPGLADPSAAKPILESRFSRVKKIGETDISATVSRTTGKSSPERGRSKSGSVAASLPARPSR